MPYYCVQFLLSTYAVRVCFLSEIHHRQRKKENIIGEYQRRFEHIRPPYISGVVGWNLALSGVRYCNFFNFLLFSKPFYGYNMAFFDFPLSKSGVDKMIQYPWRIPLPMISNRFVVAAFECCQSNLTTLPA